MEGVARLFWSELSPRWSVRGERNEKGEACVVEEDKRREDVVERRLAQVARAERGTKATTLAGASGYDPSPGTAGYFVLLGCVGATYPAVNRRG